MKQNPSWEANSRSANHYHKGSLPQSQQPANEPNPEPGRFISHPRAFFAYILNIFSHLRLGFPSVVVFQVSQITVYTYDSPRILASIYIYIFFDFICFINVESEHF
jgi:hypothetical protein